MPAPATQIRSIGLLIHGVLEIKFIMLNSVDALLATSSGMQEPISAIFSAVNLLMHFIGWLTFFILVNYKLPLRPHRDQLRIHWFMAYIWLLIHECLVLECNISFPLYDLFSHNLQRFITLLMNTYLMMLAMIAEIFDQTEKLDYSSAVTVLGYSLILCLPRVFNVKDEASRVIVPCGGGHFSASDMGSQGWYNSSPLMIQAVGGCIRMCSHSASGALRFMDMLMPMLCGMPPLFLSHLWWSFVKNDAKFRTSTLAKKAK
ncbi:hypothetical protein ZIOFF_031734 [Zingiber officinale]|uniref:Post-GPI attachment to proteins factor 3 n=1 Tax=Zingiber officinale TaxID=94328 RepID=A0A8J5GFH3_ZINOF|nr:hypothetical protein ZIOFF_031734 [Zingiber officinale]